MNKHPAIGCVTVLLLLLLAVMFAAWAMIHPSYPAPNASFHEVFSFQPFKVTP